MTPVDSTRTYRSKGTFRANMYILPKSVSESDDIQS